MTQTPNAILQPTQVVIGGRTYRLRPWSYEDAAIWAFRLTKLVGSAIAAGVMTRGSEYAAFGAAIMDLDERTYVELRAVCEKYTDLVARNEGEPELFIQLDPKLHLRGRLLDSVAILKGHVVMEFADFFRGLGDLFDRPARDS